MSDRPVTIGDNRRLMNAQRRKVWADALARFSVPPFGLRRWRGEKTIGWSGATDLPGGIDEIDLTYSRGPGQPNCVTPHVTCSTMVAWDSHLYGKDPASVFVDGNLSGAWAYRGQDLSADAAAKQVAKRRRDAARVLRAKEYEPRTVMVDDAAIEFAFKDLDDLWCAYANLGTVDIVLFGANIALDRVKLGAASLSSFLRPPSPDDERLAPQYTFTAELPGRKPFS